MTYLVETLRMLHQDELVTCNDLVFNKIRNQMLGGSLLKCTL